MCFADKKLAFCKSFPILALINGNSLIDLTFTPEYTDHYMKDCSCISGLLGSKTIGSLIKTAKTLSTKTKLEILLILLNREHCVCKIQDCINKEQSLVSHHLSDLVETGWIKQRKGKDARQVFYSLTKKGRQKLQIFLKTGGVKK